MCSRYVQSDDVEVASLLEHLVELVLENGGELHPAARLVARAGDLTLECSTDDAEGEQLVKIPDSLLIPVDDLNLADISTELRLVDSPDHLTQIQRELLDLHIDLYNATNKIPLMVRTHPGLNLRQLPEAVAVLERLRPGYLPLEQTAPQVLLQTRWLARRDRSVAQTERAGEGPEARRVRVIMPIIDLLNHHPNGSPFRGTSSLRVTVSRNGGRECFAQYLDRKDVLDLALGYAYLDTNVREAVSVRSCVEVEGLGEVRVRGGRPKRASALDPPLIEESADGVEFSHLVFNEEYPERFRTSLQMALQACLVRRGVPHDQLDAIVAETASAIAQSNIAELQNLSRSVERERDNESCELIVAATRRQIEIIETVVPDVNT